MASPSFRRLQRNLAVVTPCVIVLGVLANAAIAGWPSRLLVAGAGLLVLGASLSFCLHKRSKNLETAWFSVRVLPDPPGAEQEPVNPLSPDFLFVVGAVGFMALALAYPHLAR